MKVRTGRTDRSDGSVGVWAYLPEMMEEQGNLIDGLISAVRVVSAGVAPA